MTARAMARRGAKARRRLGGAMLVGVMALLAAASRAETAVDEPVEESRPAAPRGDRIWPNSDEARARIQRAFAFYDDVVLERRDEAASGNGRESADTVPTPPPSVVMVAPEAAAPTHFEPVVPDALPAAYAPPQPEPQAAIDRAMGKVIAAPLPRRRPTPPPPTPAGEEAQAEADVLPPGVGLRVATLVPVPMERPAPPKESATEAPIAAEGPILGEPKRIPKEALPYLAIIRREAAANKVPLWLAIGVGWVESKYNPKLRGTHGVVGLMQVMPSTARFQGYKGSTEQLLDPETNIVWGLRELGWGWAKSGGNACLAVAKYKGGIATRTIPSAAASYCAAAKRVTGMM